MRTTIIATSSSPHTSSGCNQYVLLLKLSEVHLTETTSDRRIRDVCKIVDSICIYGVQSEGYLGSVSFLRDLVVNAAGLRIHSWPHVEIHIVMTPRVGYLVALTLSGKDVLHLFALMSCWLHDVQASRFSALFSLRPRVPCNFVLWRSDVVCKLLPRAASTMVENNISRIHFCYLKMLK